VPATISVKGDGNAFAAEITPHLNPDGTIGLDGSLRAAGMRSRFSARYSAHQGDPTGVTDSTSAAVARPPPPPDTLRDRRAILGFLLQVISAREVNVALGANATEKGPLAIADSPCLLCMLKSARSALATVDRAIGNSPAAPFLSRWRLALHSTFAGRDHLQEENREWLAVAEGIRPAERSCGRRRTSNR